MKRLARWGIQNVSRSVLAVAPPLVVALLTASLTSEACAEMMQGRDHRSRGGYGTGTAVGTGLAIGIIGNALQNSRRQPETIEQKGGGRKAKARKNQPSQVRTTGKDKTGLSKKGKTGPACQDCKPLEDSIDQYEGILKDQAARLASEEEYKRRHERQLATITDPGMRTAWRQVIATSTSRIEELKAMTAAIKAMADERRSQLKDKIAGHNPATPSPPVTALPIPVAGPTDPTPPVAQNPPGTPSAPATPSSAPPTNPTPGSAPAPEPTPIASSGPCPIHVAEVTNADRVFHRIYIRGPGRRKDPESENYFFDLKVREIRAAIEAPGLQAPGSTSLYLEEPSFRSVFQSIYSLSRSVNPCEEVTIYFSGHGFGGQGLGVETNVEKYGEGIELNNRAGEVNDFTDEVMGMLVAQFRPGVSITFLMDTCYGGGFAGKGNVEESDLISVIGTRGPCYIAGNTVSAALIREITSLGAGSPRKRVTAAALKNQLTLRNWPLGQPFDSSQDLQPGRFSGNE